MKSTSPPPFRQHSLISYRLLNRSTDSSIFNVKSFVLRVVTEDGQLLRYASKELQNDKEVVLKAYRNQPISLKHASMNLMRNRKFSLLLIASGGRYLKYASLSARNDQAAVLLAVGWCGGNLKYASSQMQNDVQVVMAAITKHYSALQFASDVLKADCEVVLAALKQSWKAIKYVSFPLLINATVGDFGGIAQNRHTCNFHSRAIELQPILFKYLSSENAKSNYNLVLSAVTHKGRYLEHASEELRSNHAIVLAAVKQNWTSLEFAHHSLYSDKAVMMEALKQCPNAMQYAADSLYRDKDIMLLVVKRNPSIIANFLAIQWRSDFDIMHECVKQDGLLLQYASVSSPYFSNMSPTTIHDQRKENMGFTLLSNTEIVLAAVKQNGLALQYSHRKDMREMNNEEIVLAAVKQNGSALRHVSFRPSSETAPAPTSVSVSKTIFSQDLIVDFNIAMHALVTHPATLFWISSHKRFQHFEVYLHDLYSRFSLTLDTFRSSFLFGIILSSQKGASTTVGGNHENHQKKTGNEIAVGTDATLSTTMTVFSSSKVEKVFDHNQREMCVGHVGLEKLNRLSRYHLAFVKRLVGEYAGLQHGERYKLVRTSSKVCSSSKQKEMF